MPEPWLLALGNALMGLNFGMFALSLELKG